MKLSRRFKLKAFKKYKKIFNFLLFEIKWKRNEKKKYKNLSVRKYLYKWYDIIDDTFIYLTILFTLLVLYHFKYHKLIIV